METHAAQTTPTPVLTPGDEGDLEQPNHGDDGNVGEPETTAVSEQVIHMIGDAFNNPPAGFTVHPKLQQLLNKRSRTPRPLKAPPLHSSLPHQCRRHKPRHNWKLRRRLLPKSLHLPSPRPEPR